ncbi:hypothetical protein ACJMK2_005963 [Sinanodonta woodiana]|uniref:Peptidase M12B domain-containing protein n=1 Tax=Sinanodonta woodiana TaxID=1069815 RepID=A0ABD3VUU8_SINWO
MIKFEISGRKGVDVSFRIWRCSLIGKVRPKGNHVREYPRGNHAREHPWGNHAREHPWGNHVRKHPRGNHSRERDLNSSYRHWGLWKELKDGKNVKCKRTGTDERYGFYQDRHTRASILVKCMKDVCKPLGSFTVSGRQYILDLAHRAVESKSLLTPVERHPEMKISMEGDMVFYKSDSLAAAVQKQTNDSRTESDVHVFPGFKTTPQHQESKHRNKTRIVRESEKGNPSGTDVVEIMVYTDEIMCNRFYALKNNDRTAGLEATRFYYALLVNEMDQVYQGFQEHPSNSAGLAIRLAFSGILIACDSAGAPWSTNRTNASSDLSDFATWHNNLKLKLNLKYDIAMGISGYVVSFCVAFAHAICDAQAGASIIYDTRFSTWLMTTAVHELGHILGASHDQSHGCSGGFLMSVNAFTANTSTATTQYEFTNCAISAIERIITKLGSSRCTLNHNFNDTQYDQYRAGAIGGDVVSLDFQCQVYYGSGSFACLKLVIYADALLYELVIDADALLYQLIIYADALLYQLVIDADSLLYQLIIYADALLYQLVIYDDALLYELIIYDDALLYKLLIYADPLLYQLLVIYADALLYELVIDADALLYQLIIYADALLYQLVIDADSLLYQLIIYADALLYQLVIYDDALLYELIIYDDALLYKLLIYADPLLYQLVIYADALLYQLVIDADALLYELIIYDDALLYKLLIYADALLYELVIYADPLLYQLIIYADALL